MSAIVPNGVASIKIEFRMISRAKLTTLPVANICIVICVQNTEGATCMQLTYS